MQIDFLQWGFPRPPTASSAALPPLWSKTYFPSLLLLPLQQHHERSRSGTRVLLIPLAPPSVLQRCLCSPRSCVDLACVCVMCQRTTFPCLHSHGKPQQPETPTSTARAAWAARGTLEMLPHLISCPSQVPIARQVAGSPGGVGSTGVV